MKYLLLITFCFWGVSSFSQGYIGKSRQKIIKGLTKYLEKDSVTNSPIKESADAIVLSVNDPKLKQVDFIYYTNSLNKCIAEKVIARCDTCYTKFTNNILADKNYGWKKVQDNLYVSKYNKKLQLELYKEDQFTYVIRKTNWTKEEYNRLTH
jgi:hypothetical protein